MKKSLVILPLVIFVALFLGCRCEQETAAPVDLGSEEAAVKAVIHQFWHSFETSDINLLSEVMAQDPEMVIIGSDAAERWVGYEEFKTAMEQQFTAM